MKDRMKRFGMLLLWVSSLLAAPVAAADLDSTLKAHTRRSLGYAPGELLVKYRPTARAAARTHQRTTWGMSTLRTFKAIGVHHLKLPAQMTVGQALELYRDDPAVEYAEPNYYRSVTAIPNDTYFNRLWGLHNTGQRVNGRRGTPDADIDGPEAWDITTGSSSVVVAVIDSGVDYHHPDLSDNIWINPGEVAGNGIDDDGNGYIDDVRGWDFLNRDNDPTDSNGHGTHVAGTIAAVGNNGIGVTGVSWTAGIMVLKVANAFGFLSSADAISAIEYANAMGAHVINNSWAGPVPSQAEKDAIDASSAVVVCAAGNDSTDNDSSPQYPASYDSAHIIAVAATDQDDNLATFSNYGAASVDVAAPGTNIYSCAPRRQTLWKDTFDDNDITDWATGGTNSAWGITTAFSYSGPYSLSDSPAGNYQDNTDSWARAPVLDLASHRGTKLEFKLRGSSETSLDLLYVQASTNGSSWIDQDILLREISEVYSRVSGDFSGFWYSAVVDLGAYDGEDAVYIRFRFASDDTITDDGWYIDDTAVTAVSHAYDGTEYRFLQGTSMATPHVSGLAVLIKAQNPVLTNIEIKAAIEDSVDPKASLSGRVVTGGKVNAYNAVIPPPAPGSLSATAASASQIDLSWGDNSPNESGFEIERRSGSEGTYQQVTRVDPNETSYHDTELNGTTTYYYRVRAYNAAGDSDYSNEAQITTSLSEGGGGGGGGCFIASAAWRPPTESHRGVTEALFRPAWAYLVEKGTEIRRAWLQSGRDLRSDGRWQW